MQTLFETPSNVMTSSCSAETGSAEGEILVDNDDNISHGGFSTDTDNSIESAQHLRHRALNSSSSTGSYSEHHHQQQSVTDNVERILAQELNKLSVQERVQALEDIHGVSGGVEVDPETVSQKLQELEALISRRKTKLYQLAESLSSTYVQNDDFRLMFLQADLFDVAAAAKRLFKFVDYKHKLFGRDKLVKDITIADLSPEDLFRLERGTLQVLLEQDTAGRPVIGCFTQLEEPIQNLDSMLRVVYYIFMSLITSYPDVRTKGFVWVFYNTHEKPTKSNPKLAWRGLKLRHSLPIRTVTNHFCTRHGSRFFGVILAMWWRINGSYTRARVRRHTGSDVECRKNLRAFGLPMACFPIDDSGTMNLNFHQEWIRRRKAMEGIQSTTKSTIATTAVNNNNNNNNDKSNGNEIKMSCDLGKIETDQGITTLDMATGAAAAKTDSHQQSRRTKKDVAERKKDQMEAFASNNKNVKPHASLPRGVPSAEHRQNHLAAQSFQQQQQQQQQQMAARGRQDFASMNPPMLGPNSQQIPMMVPMMSSSIGSSSPVQQRPPHFGLSQPSMPMSSDAASFSNPNNIPGPPTSSPSSPPTVYISPTPEDVLFGRGKPTRNHPGNVRFRNLLEAHMVEYNSAPKFVKCIIAKKLVQTLRYSGARFLKPTTGANSGWVIASEKVAQDKVSQYFRSRRGA